MKKFIPFVASLIAGATLALSASAAMAQGRPEFRPHHVAPVRHVVHHRHHRVRHVAPARSLHDRDGDGVPNRFDARPNNPYRH